MLDALIQVEGRTAAIILPFDTPSAHADVEAVLEHLGLECGVPG